jgi:hypothetical protein
VNALGEGFLKAVETDFDRAFREAITPTARKKVQEALDAWLSFTARKKQSANLVQQEEQMRKRFQVLAENFQLHYEHGKLVVKANGDAESTLRMLEHGTYWFDPVQDVTKLIAGAALI